MTSETPSITASRVLAIALTFNVTTMTLSQAARITNDFGLGWLGCFELICSVGTCGLIVASIIRDRF